MKRWTIFALLLPLAGCASQPCDTPWSESRCREESLLYQNDLLQAKLLIVSGDPETYELANVLLKRAAPHDKTGETEFYKAVMLIRMGPQVDEVLELLQQAVDKGHPHATALMYKIYAEPYLLETPDPLKAETYRARYAELDVAKSGYPSFEKALNLVSALVGQPAALAGAHAPDP
jgi:hypothetical protein